jgi:hypothetical protein
MLVVLALEEEEADLGEVEAAAAKAAARAADVVASSCAIHA